MLDLGPSMIDVSPEGGPSKVMNAGWF